MIVIEQIKIAGKCGSYCCDIAANYNNGNVEIIRISDHYTLEELDVSLLYGSLWWKDKQKKLYLLTLIRNKYIAGINV